MSAGHQPKTNFSHVLVVGRSPVNRVVVSKIVERCGLRPVSEPPELANRILTSLRPGMVIVDGGAGDNDCDQLLATLHAMRNTSVDRLPRVILLANAAANAKALAASHDIDAVVAKPIMPETLQPVIDRLRARG